MRLMENFGDTFDGQSVMLPLPNEVPADVPRITLQNANNKLRLEIAPARVNFFALKTPDGQIDKKSFLDQARRIFETYLDTTNAVVGRLGSVLVKYWECEDAGKVLASHFCKTEYLNTVLSRPEKFELHAYKRYSLEKFVVNSWVRSKTKDESSIIVEQDLNTLSENIEKENYSKSSMDEFFNLTSTEHESILDRYFPKP